MAWDSIHTVFISSTFEDLREERAEVQKAVLRLGCLPIGMELFPSADDDAWGFIKGEIERSDYYVLIVGGRYGSVAHDGISYTEKEYRYARELNKPSLVFVRSSAQPISQDKVEQDDEKRKKLQKFLSDLNQSRLAQRFENLHHLGGNAYYSLNELRKQRPAPGYVRSGHNNNRANDASTSVEAAKAMELARKYDQLMAEHRALAEKHEELKLSIKHEEPGQRRIVDVEQRAALKNPLLITDYEQICLYNSNISPKPPDIKLGHLFVLAAECLSSGAPGFVENCIIDKVCRSPDIELLLRTQPARRSEIVSTIDKLRTLGLTKIDKIGRLILTDLGKQQYDQLKDVYRYISSR